VHAKSKPLVLLDDIMSGLDSATASAVFDNLCSRNGLLMDPTRKSLCPYGE
jgi:hypothetical protein